MQLIIMLSYSEMFLCISYRSADKNDNILISYSSIIFYFHTNAWAEYFFVRIVKAEIRNTLFINKALGLITKQPTWRTKIVIPVMHC